MAKPAYTQPYTQPAIEGARRRDPKQDAAAREEAEQEARNRLADTLASERRQRLTTGSREAITDDVSAICGRIACGASIKTVSTEFGIAADMLSAWLLAPERAQQYNTALLAAAHLFATEIVEIADDLRIPPADRREMISARTWAAKTMGREFYADRLPTQIDEPQVSIPAGDLLRAAVALAMQSGLGEQLRELLPVATVQRAPIAGPVDDKE